eukprot:gnl/Dysnectes_brevis/647_a715_1972.p1 GENE.gnl/Dysnectes_brevis/647_a715_1972~~gnl/Dysnectes_brevis/647_a715_1972.p1  ORF type:complete len:867 (-),score=274.10 gnl/Dysnectes_brevis/647_a715_1972:107-2707(-)
MAETITQLLDTYVDFLTTDDELVSLAEKIQSVACADAPSFKSFLSLYQEKVTKLRDAELHRSSSLLHSIVKNCQLSFIKQEASTLRAIILDRSTNVFEKTILADIAYFLFVNDLIPVSFIIPYITVLSKTKPRMQYLKKTARIGILTIANSIKPMLTRASVCKALLVPLLLAVEGEKDPESLYLSFQLVGACRDGLPIEEDKDDLHQASSDWLADYFPLTFRPAPGSSVTYQQLLAAYKHAFLRPEAADELWPSALDRTVECEQPSEKAACFATLSELAVISPPATFCRDLYWAVSNEVLYGQTKTSKDAALKLLGDLAASKDEQVAASLCTSARETVVRDLTFNASKPGPLRKACLDIAVAISASQMGAETTAAALPEPMVKAVGASKDVDCFVLMKALEEMAAYWQAYPTARSVLATHKYVPPLLKSVLGQSQRWGDAPLLALCRAAGPPMLCLPAMALEPMTSSRQLLRARALLANEPLEDGPRELLVGMAGWAGAGEVDRAVSACTQLLADSELLGDRFPGLIGDAGELAAAALRDLVVKTTPEQSDIITSRILKPLAAIINLIPTTANTDLPPQLACALVRAHQSPCAPLPPILAAVRQGVPGADEAFAIAVPSFGVLELNAAVTEISSSITPIALRVSLALIGSDTHVKEDITEHKSDQAIMSALTHIIRVLRESGDVTAITTIRDGINLAFTEQVDTPRRRQLITQLILAAEFTSQRPVYPLVLTTLAKACLGAVRPTLAHGLHAAGREAAEEIIPGAVSENNEVRVSCLRACARMCRDGLLPVPEELLQRLLAQLRAGRAGPEELEALAALGSSACSFPTRSHYRSLITHLLQSLLGADTRAGREAARRARQTWIMMI